MKAKNGFTLIEISIVLVVIGLIVGGILVGQDLISAAAVRAQVTQIEKYNSAVNTFRGKYNNQLPGDITAASASMFGFTTRTGGAGQGDGNGVVEGALGSGTVTGQGELTMFWNDISTAGLIDGQFPNNISYGSVNTIENGGQYPTSEYYPQAKIGNGNYVFAWSGGYGKVYADGSGTGGSTTTPSWHSDYNNYFCLSGMNGGVANGYEYSNPGITVAQAYAIDKKMDDGFPASGKVTAMYPNFNTYLSGAMIWANGNGSVSNGYATGTNGTAATASATTTCFDNSNTTPNASGVAAGVAGAIQHYSMEVQNGAGINCALSFQFQ